MSFYNIHECPWKQSLAPVDSKLLESSLYSSKYPPSVRLDQSKVMEWEASSRNIISVSSHMDWFISATVALLDGVKNKLHDEPSDREAWQDLWNDTSDATDLLTSVGKGLQDIVKSSVSEVGSMVVTRRDSWLEYMKSKITKEEVCSLRAGSLNKDTLFGSTELDKVQEVMDQRQASKVHKKILYEKVAPQQQPSRSFENRSFDNRPQFERWSRDDYSCRKVER